MGQSRNLILKIRKHSNILYTMSKLTVVLLLASTATILAQTTENGEAQVRIKIITGSTSNVSLSRSCPL